MKKLGIYLGLLGLLTGSIHAQADKPSASHIFTVAGFNTLFRQLDLNPQTENKYSITESEYARLREAWNELPEEERMLLQNSREGWQDFAEMLLFDLAIGTEWKAHVNKAKRYGAENISITVSRYKRVITVKRARKTLVDLIQDGPHMLLSGGLALSKEIKEQARKRTGSKALERLNLWERLINSHREEADDMKKIRAVSAFLAKHIQETRDRGELKGYDYWQSPIETLVRGRGDCDDFAVATYVSLRLLGIPAEHLRIALIQHPYRGGHAVVFFYPGNEQDPWVIDNLPSDQFGSQFGRILRLSTKIRFDEIKPLWGMNESMVCEYAGRGNEIVTGQDPRVAFPAFAIALSNSKRLLPPPGPAHLAYTASFNGSQEQ